MDWTSDTTGAQYTLTHGTCHARVWQSPVDHWSAVVTTTRSTVGQENFIQVADAWAWCERQLAAFVDDGHCTAEGGVPPL